MDILNKPIDTFKFEDIIAFCKEGHPEGVQLDYKKDFPKNGFAKHFAAFSNTRGGVIIIGVEENIKSGVPITWEGVAKDAKQIEKIHQQACNVEPIPSYQIHTTEEVNGKCFILIRINEGDKTPYYVQNDSNVWTRTGNVSNPIDIASPDGLELLFGKRERAKKARNLYLKMAEETYSAGLEREEKKKEKTIQEIKEKGSTTDYFKYKLGTNVVLCSIAIQPYFPQKSLARPREIKENLEELRFDSRHISFPDHNMEPIPEGIFHFTHSYSDGYIECQQVLGQGMIYKNFDVMRIDKSGVKTVRLWSILANIFAILQFAKNMYSHFNYQGILEGSIILEGMAGVNTYQILPNGWSDPWDNGKISFLPNYRWAIHLDTNILNNSAELKKYFVNLLHEIYWSLGYSKQVQEELIDAFLKDSDFRF